MQHPVKRGDFGKERGEGSGGKDLAKGRTLMMMMNHYIELFKLKYSIIIINSSRPTAIPKIKSHICIKCMITHISNIQ